MAQALAYSNEQQLHAPAQILNHGLSTLRHRHFARTQLPPIGGHGRTAQHVEPCADPIHREHLWSQLIVHLAQSLSTCSR